MHHSAVRAQSQNGIHMVDRLAWSSLVARVRIAACRGYIVAGAGAAAGIRTLTVSIVTRLRIYVVSGLGVGIGRVGGLRICIASNSGAGEVDGLGSIGRVVVDGDLASAGACSGRRELGAVSTGGTDG